MNETFFLELPPENCPSDIVSKAKRILERTKEFCPNPVIPRPWGKIRHGQNGTWLLECYLDWKKMVPEIDRLYLFSSTIKPLEHLGTFEFGGIVITAHFISALVDKLKRRAHWDLDQKSAVFKKIFLKNGGCQKEWDEFMARFQ